MKGTCYVKELNEDGLYVSELDEDNAFKSKANPRGTFAMIVEPFSEGDIYYKKFEDGYLVYGEAYILEARKDILKRRLSKWKYTKPKNLTHVEDDSLQI